MSSTKEGPKVGPRLVLVRPVFIFPEKMLLIRNRPSHEMEGRKLSFSVVFCYLIPENEEGG